MNLQTLPIDRYKRLLVVSPHPDDETLIAGGLMQCILAGGGEVRVVISTNGDCEQIAPRKEFHHLMPSPEDFIRLGNMRQEEEIAGLESLGVADENIYFLSYPDLGLSQLWAHFWHPAYPFRSDTTKMTRSPYPRTFNPEAVYAGECYYQDLVKIIDGYRPDLITFTNSFDTHPDHRSVETFTRLAISAVQIKDPAYQPDAFGSMVHRAKYPLPAGNFPDLELLPPDYLTALGSDWLRLDLQPDQVSNKLSALYDYRSQMMVMKDFLVSFGRKNELFTTLPVVTLQHAASGDRLDPRTWQDAAGDPIKVLDRSPSMDFYGDEILPGTDVVKTYAAQSPDGSLWVAMKLRGKARKHFHYVLGVMGVDPDGNLHYLQSTNHQPAKDDTLAELNGHYVLAEFPVEDLAGARRLFIGGLVSGPKNIVLDNSNWPLVMVD